MKNYRIKQASSDYEGFMKGAGFKHQRDDMPPGFASHMIPAPGNIFFVQYREPSDECKKHFRYDQTDWSGYDGEFILTRVRDGKTVIVDSGPASDSHIHTGIDTLTFYGKGRALPGGTWSFHCEREPEN